MFKKWDWNREIPLFQAVVQLLFFRFWFLYQEVIYLSAVDGEHESPPGERGGAIESDPATAVWITKTHGNKLLYLVRGRGSIDRDLGETVERGFVPTWNGIGIEKETRDILEKAARMETSDIPKGHGE